VPNLSSYVPNGWRRLSLAVVLALSLAGCEFHSPDEERLTANTQIALMDWHVAGFWVINSPVAWIRVANYNQVPIKEITFQYQTFTEDGRPLNKGTFTIEGTVAPRSMKNFIELYLGIVDLYSQRLDVKLLSVKPANE
jgi:hypothetical protein